LWVCTPEGLSRFDGYQFTNYRTEQGLPGNNVSAFLETRQGVYWVGTTAGLSRFDPTVAGAKKFQGYTLPGDRSAQSVNVLGEDRNGAVWCGTHTGLFRLAKDGTAFERVQLDATVKGAGPAVTALLEDRRGALWVGASPGLYRREPDGRTISCDRLFEPIDPKAVGVRAILEDREGRMWFGTTTGLWRTDSAAMPLHLYSKELVNDQWVNNLLQSADGRIWIGTSSFLAEWIPRAGSPRGEFEFYGPANGLSGCVPLTEDRDGNLWMSSHGSGLLRMARNGFITYSAEDGLRGLPTNVGGFLETRRGELCFFNRSVIHRFDGRRFIPIHPAFPRDITYFGWGYGSLGLQDREGDWWIATGQGLCRFPPVTLEKLAGVPPKAIYRTADGLPGDNIFQVFEDSRGDIWIGIIGNPSGMARWERRTARIHTYSVADAPSAPTAFAEDRGGNIWIGFYNGYLQRCRNGRFTMFTNLQGVPEGGWKRLYVDSAGRLWVGARRGLGRTDNPTADTPQFVTYTTAQGLASNEIFGITEDREGRIYVATGRGVDLLTPQASSLAAGDIQHLTYADGLVAGELTSAFRDHKGDLWFATNFGLSQFTPTTDRHAEAAPVLVTGVQVGAASYPVADVGQAEVQGPGLRSGQGPLRIDFVGLSFKPGERLRYQYRVEGLDRDWSTPTDQRTVVYGRLASGKYRFQVRAVNSKGSISPEPATVVFAMLPPIWLSWWFLSLAALASGALVYVFHLYRVRQLLAIERVRTRIATDLHDDIGSSLSQISILSELARYRLDTGDPKAAQPLGEIATVSREMVAALSDIVWAINPRHDRLSELTARMRRFAVDVLGTRGIDLRFEADCEEQQHTSSDFRRQLYLIFKEAVNNAARHSACTQARVEMHVWKGRLELRISDNGRGFEPSTAGTGNGLVNMQRRATGLGGTFEVHSEPDCGTDLKLSVPLPGSRTP
jgi:ligand-binding sensor domain-containing protein/signal transduction histidine kinase